MNKTIWMYWHQGFDQANDLVQRCVASWRFHNPDWKLMLLDHSNVHEYIGHLNIPANKLSLLKVQHRSDLIRTQLLIKYGGVWADPTCFCMRPLQEWIPDYLQAGFFFFHKPGRDRVIANWFIAVKHAGDPVLTKLYDALCQYWSKYDFRNYQDEFPLLEGILERLVNRNPPLTRLWLTPLFTRVLKLYPYMIYHYMFNKLVSDDPACREQWERMPRISASNAPKLQRLGLLNPLTEEARLVIDQREVPLFKLKWNIKTDSIKGGTIVDYLFKTIA
jgi:hypothetical protein